MNNTIYMKDGFVKVNYNSESRVLYVLWKSLFDQNIVRECCERQLEEVRKGAKVIVIDVSKARGLILEVNQKWFENYLFNRLAKAGLRAIITIDSEIPAVRLSSKRWTQAGTSFSFDMVTVKSKEEAAKVVAEYF